MDKWKDVSFTEAELIEMLEKTGLTPLQRKLVGGLKGLLEPMYVTTVEELDALPVETAIRVGSEGRTRMRVKSVNGAWVGAGKEGPSSVESQNVMYWYSRAEVLHIGTGWNP